MKSHRSSRRSVPRVTRKREQVATDLVSTTAKPSLSNVTKPSKTLREIMLDAKMKKKTGDDRETFPGASAAVAMSASSPITGILCKNPQSVTVEQLEGMVKARGAEGPPGPPGHVGPRGLEGSPGPDGQQGKTGLRGGVGPKGAQGGIGPQGQPGKQGVVGSRGPAGSSGAVGPAGPTGIAGPAGKPGASVEGKPGQRGLPGAQGAPGPVGADGVEGLQGKTGADGAPGLVGPQGPCGPEGPAGRCKCQKKPKEESAQPAMALPGATDIEYLGAGKWRVQTGENELFTLTGRKSLSK